jgi:Rieske Fe-S protein
VPSGTPVKTADVPVGGGVIQGSSFVVTQPSAGQFKAFSPICTHQGCPVTKIQNGMIVCPCHNSMFDISTGTPTASSEAKSPLTGKTATVSGDSVYIA